ncbi:MAG: helix-turn-helix domain-containing protein [Candidatus Methanofastidiosia archaeon]|jgi:DNA-binding transcriptional regulator GbsR (MarR family)
MNTTIRNELVHELVSMARYWGLSEGSAAMYAALALAGTQLTMTELQDVTGYSLSSVSNHLRSLIDKYLVTRTKKEGVYVYKAETNFEGIFKLLTKELLERNIIPLYKKVKAFKEKEGSLNQHIPDLEKEMQKLIDYLTTIITIEGEAHAIEEDQIFVSSVS